MKNCFNRLFLSLLVLLTCCTYSNAQVRPQVGLATSGRPSTMMAGGFFHALIISDGKVYAAGSNYYGQLGDGTDNSSKTFIEVQGLDNVIAVSAGLFHSMALKADGTVWTWGLGAYGVLGQGKKSYSE